VGTPLLNNGLQEVLDAAKDGRYNLPGGDSTDDSYGAAGAGGRCDGVS